MDEKLKVLRFEVGIQVAYLKRGDKYASVVITSLLKQIANEFGDEDAENVITKFRLNELGY
jgi:hypothetical protein